VIRAASRFAHLKAPAVIPNQKAILVIQGNNTVVENIEFSGASVHDRNGAGIRQEGSNVAVRNCFFHDCEDGILGGSGSVLIEYSEFAACGFGDGYSHNMYIAACDSFTLRFCYTHDAAEGHTVKSRAFRNYILYNRIESANSTTSYEINLPNAGRSFIIGNQIQQGTGTHNSTIIDYGSEGIAGHDTSLFVINNTLVNDRSSGTFISISNTQTRPEVCNNLFVGGGAVSNRPLDSAGNVITDSPGFADRANFDYHLTSSSPAVDKGVNPGSIGSYQLAPQFEYVKDAAGRPRSVLGSGLDAGAFEFSSSSVNKGSLPFPKHGYGTGKRIGFNPLFDLRGRRMAPETHPRHSWQLGPSLPPMPDSDAGKH
jgi:hypothetical protein